MIGLVGELGRFLRFCIQAQVLAIRVVIAVAGASWLLLLILLLNRLEALVLSIGILRLEHIIRHSILLLRLRDSDRAVDTRVIEALRLVRECHVEVDWHTHTGLGHATVEKILRLMWCIVDGQIKR